MLLTGGDGAVFELLIRGYEHSSGDWLVIHTRVRSRAGDWDSVDPSLEGGDVLALSRWLTAHAEGRTKQRDIEFTEPNLSFEVLRSTEEGVTVRVYFELESRPPWAEKRHAGDKDLWVELEVGRGDLRAAADALRDGLERVRRKRRVAPTDEGRTGG